MARDAPINPDIGKDFKAAPESTGGDGGGGTGRDVTGEGSGFTYTGGGGGGSGGRRITDTGRAFTPITTDVVALEDTAKQLETIDPKTSIQIRQAVRNIKSSSVTPTLRQSALPVDATSTDIIKAARWEDPNAPIELLRTITRETKAQQSLAGDIELEYLKSPEVQKQQSLEDIRIISALRKKAKQEGVPASFIRQRQLIELREQERQDKAFQIPIVHTPLDEYIAIKRGQLRKVVRTYKKVTEPIFTPIVRAFDKAVAPLKELSTDAGYQQRYQDMKKREDALEKWKQNLYSKDDISGISVTPKEVHWGQKGYFKELGKYAVRAPIEIASLVPFIGGRLPYLAETVIRGGTDRQLLAAQTALLPAAVLRSMHPGTAEGAGNLLLITTPGILKTVKKASELVPITFETVKFTAKTPPTQKNLAKALDALKRGKKAVTTYIGRKRTAKADAEVKGRLVERDGRLVLERKIDPKTYIKKREAAIKKKREAEKKAALKAEKPKNFFELQYDNVLKNIYKPITKKRVTIRTIGVERKGRAKILLTQRGLSLRRGQRPVKQLEKIPLKDIKGSITIPKTATGTEALLQSLKLKPAEAKRVALVQDILRLGGKEKGIKVTEVDLALDGIKPSSNNIIVKHIKKDFYVYGSFTTKQLPKQFQTKYTDLDAMAPKMTQRQVINSMKKLEKKLQKAGDDVTLSESKLELLNAKGDAIFEAKPGKGKTPTLETVSDKALGFILKDKLRKMGELKAEIIGVQLKKKGAAITFVRGKPSKKDIAQLEEVTTGTLYTPELKIFKKTEVESAFAQPGIFPKPHRLKDLPDFIITGKGIAFIRRGKDGKQIAVNIKKFIKTYTKAQRSELGKLIQQRLREAPAKQRTQLQFQKTLVEKTIAQFRKSLKSSPKKAAKLSPKFKPVISPKFIPDPSPKAIVSPKLPITPISPRLLKPVSPRVGKTSPRSPKITKKRSPKVASPRSPRVPVSPKPPVITKRKPIIIKIKPFSGQVIKKIKTGTLKKKAIRFTPTLIRPHQIQKELRFYSGAEFR